MVEARKDIVINFGEVAADADAELFIQLDEVANLGKTSFDPGDTVFLRLHRNPLNSYVTFKSGGVLNLEGSNVSYPVSEEMLIFANTDEQSLSYWPNGGVSYTWMGDDPGVSLVFDGKTVIAPSDITAIAICTYNTLGDRWSITYDEEGTVVIVGLMGEVQGSINVQWGGDAAGPEDYNLKVIDYCTGDVVAGATVFLDGVNVGFTNSNGIIALGSLEPGTTHTLKIIKAGYIDSDIDQIKNDSFTVPG